MIETCIRPDPNFERLRNTLLRKGAPTRVPFIELAPDPEITEAVLEKPFPEGDDPEALRGRVEHSIEFYHRLGYDFVGIGCGPVFKSQWHRAEDTALRPHKSRMWMVSTDSAIRDRDDFEKYPWPEPSDTDFRWIEHANKSLPDGMRIIAHSTGGPREVATEIMGYENLCIKLVEDRQLVKSVVDRIAELQYQAFETAVEYENVGALWGVDDWGFKTQTLISPDDLREFVFPWHKRVVELAHAHGLPALLHSCGNLEEVMDDVIDYLGYDAKHAFEDVIMPVEDVKDKYGDRIAILGGMDVDFLARATPDEVTRRTRKVLEHCMAGGGYCLGTGNSVANYIPVENYIAMLEAGWDFRP